MNTVFLRVLEAEDKERALLDAVRSRDTVSRQQRFEKDPSTFSIVPGSPFCYWIGDGLAAVFEAFSALENGSRSARAGGQTSDDARYLRAWWEIGANVEAPWHTYLKGGPSTKFYVDQSLVAPWSAERSTFPGFLGRPGRASEKPSNYELYFNPGITWPLRASKFAPQIMPSGCIFTVRSYAILDDEDKIFPLLGVLSSSVVDYISKLMLGRFGYPEFVVGVLQKLPIPTLSDEEAARCRELARRAWQLERRLDTRIETSHAFNAPALLQVDGDTLADRMNAYRSRAQLVKAELAAIQSEIDEVCYGLYRVSDDDRRLIQMSLVSEQTESQDNDGDGAEFEGDDGDDPCADLGVRESAADVVAWALGVAFGRFDVRLAEAESQQSGAVDPFAKLPLYSESMLINKDGKLLQKAPPGYPVNFSEDGILVDDPGHPRDVSAAIRAVFDVVFGSKAEVWWSAISAELDPKSRELRAWITSSLFQHHLTRYSKSRRKAPLFWQLGVASGRYSVWLYAHKLSRDAIIQIQADLVAPKLAYEERQLAALMQSQDPDERKEVPDQMAFVDELRHFLEELKRAGSLWSPLAEDGVVLSMAPLWRLCASQKSWQKELKEKWSGLVAGKYDWSGVAMHLWPERVLEKCAADRSIAIAHGLENVFWFVDDQGEWKAYNKPKTPIAQLIRERTSANVKAALKSLIEAPDVATGTKRNRKSKAA